MMAGEATEKLVTKTDPCGCCYAPAGKRCAWWCPEGEAADLGEFALESDEEVAP